MIRSSLLLILCLLSTTSPVAAGTLDYFIGKPRPDIILPDLDGKQRSLDEWNGKVLVINFWATWCVPCRREIPAFNRIQKAGGDQVRFVGVAIDNTAAIKQFMAQTPIDYPVLVAGAGGAAIAEAYGNEAGALPYTVIVDRHGRISALAAGLFPEARLQQQIDRLLAH